MESLPTNQLIKFNNDTLEFLRKQYGFDKRERLDEAITILVDWLKKEEHIVRKNYPAHYLERTIIICKGSVERAKMKLDKLATFRTFLPQYFEPITSVKEIPLFSDLMITLLPKMTPDHYRIYMLKNVGKQFDSGFFDFYRHLVMLCEFIQAHDYCNGVIAILDYTETSVFELIKALNIIEIRNIMAIIIEGFGMRLKGIHIISSSKAIDTFIQIFKQAMSAKVGERIQVHKNIESLYNYVPKDIMPSDYGGQEKSLKELDKYLNDELCSEKFTKYFKEMQAACTNENYRRDDKFNEQYMGMPGSFRKLTVD